MSGREDSYETEWRKRVDASPDAKEARNNLEFHRRKMQELHQELKIAETWEAELEERLKKVEGRLKPAMMRFTELLNLTSGMEECQVEEIVSEVEDPSKIVSVLKKKAKSVDQMTRSQLIGFVKTIIHLRNAFLDQDIQAGSVVMQEMASTVLKHLGRSTINWEELSDWEMKVLRKIIGDVEGVPSFVVRMVDQMITTIIRISERSREDQEMEMN